MLCFYVIDYYCLKGDARHACARLPNGVEIQNFYIPAGGDIPDKELNKKVEKLICNSFQKTKKISKVLISQIPEIIELSALTADKRHLKSATIKIKKYQKTCSI